MLAVLLALTSAVCYGGSDFTAGLAARRAGAVRVTLAAEVAKAALVIAVVPLVSSRTPSVSSLAWGTAAGVGGVAGLMTLNLGFRHAAFSVASPLSALSAAAFSVLAGLLFGERPGALSLIGIALALPAIVAVSASADQGTTDCRPDAAARSIGRHATGVLYGLAAGAGFGLALIGLNRAGSASDLWPLAAAELASVLTAVGIAVITREFGMPPPGTRWLPVLSGSIAAAGIFSYFLATHLGLLAVTAVIYSLFPAGTILLARIVLREQLTAIRIIGLCLAAASVGLIAVSGAR